MRGFVRVVAAVPRVGVAGVHANVEQTLQLWRAADKGEAQVVVFPELGLSSYTARDLFLSTVLLDGALASLATLVRESASLNSLAFIGMPLRAWDGIYNVAVAIQAGRLLGIVPKSYLPNYREFEERRWFRPGTEVPADSVLRVLDADVPFGTDLLFAASDAPELVVGVEICEDLWVQVPPSSAQVNAGAMLICNLSASNITVGKADLRKLLCASASDRGKCAYAYVAAGPTESSTDLAWDAHALIYENGHLLAESRRFERGPQLLAADVDLEQLLHERLVTTTFGDCAREQRKRFRRVAFTTGWPTKLQRGVTPHPFVPKDPATLAARCAEVFEIQRHALATRLEHASRSRKIVLGLSGGLDSTHAALVAASALDLLGWPRSSLVCLTMPGFGSIDDTQDNAQQLSAALSASYQRVSVSELSREVLAELGHPAGAASVDELLSRVRADPKLADLSFENVQARLRTLLLMTVANRVGGIVLGTGDLSEKALGWSTYAGDQISMYDVNAGVPKTLIQFLIRWVANERVQTWVQADASALRAILFGILDTPISPELLPPDESGKIAQLTESSIGPYELHDFFLFHLLRHGRRPSRVLALAEIAFEGRYERATLRGHLETFLRRFFLNQFKRSCSADGPKVGMVALSPRSDWRMPSDADVEAWLRELADN
ncbi:MAG TPA: NAD(+) synthase [Polyangiales bacterium]|jgi:NAD+ synthase (glutamine-hydrolysing)